MTVNEGGKRVDVLEQGWGGGPRGRGAHAKKKKCGSHPPAPHTLVHRAGPSHSLTHNQGVPSFGRNQSTPPPRPRARNAYAACPAKARLRPHRKRTQRRGAAAAAAAAAARLPRGTRPARARPSCARRHQAHHHNPVREIQRRGRGQGGVHPGASRLARKQNQSAAVAGCREGAWRRGRGDAVPCGACSQKQKSRPASSNTYRPKSTPSRR